MSTPTTKYHVKEPIGLLWGIYDAQDVLFAGPFVDQAKADESCRSLNALFSEWPKGEVKSNEREAGSS